MIQSRALFDWCGRVKIQRVTMTISIYLYVSLRKEEDWRTTIRSNESILKNKELVETWIQL